MTPDDPVTTVLTAFREEAGRGVSSRSEMLGNRLYQILAPVKHHEKAVAKAGA